MATHATEMFLRQLRRFVRCDTGKSQTDANLLGRYIEERDDEAFEDLLRRHGPMVLSVCQRILPIQQDAEDAFQATFLVLVKKAASVRPRGMVGNWLYGVAHQTAIRVRALHAKKRARERQMATIPEPQAPSAHSSEELRRWLDQALSRLPGKYRAAIVACDLEGKTHGEAARELGWPVGSLSTRLVRGRALLAKRLAKHVPTLTVGILAAELSQSAPAASVPAALMFDTIKAASLFAAGQSAATAGLSTHAVAVAEGMIRIMNLTKWTTATIAVVVLAGLGAGLGVGGYQFVQGNSPVPKRNAVAADEAPTAQVKSVKSALAGNASQKSKEQRLQLGALPKSPVYDVVFSPDGKLLAVACSEKEILVYDAATGEMRLTLQTKTDRVRSVAFSPDGNLLISGCGYPSARPKEPGEINIWDVKSGKELASLSGRAPIWKVGFTPDGKSIVSASSDGAIQIWDAAKKTERLVLLDHTRGVRTFAFSPDGKVFASGSFDGTVIFWDANTFKKLKSFVAHPQGVQCIAFSPSGRSFVTCEWPDSTRSKSSVKIWDYAGGHEITQVEGIDEIILNADFSPDERLLALSGGDQSKSSEVKLIEVASGKVRAAIPGHTQLVACIRFSPDGEFFISGGGNSKSEFQTNYLVDLRPAPAKGELSAKEVERLWTILAGGDAEEAYRAICLLAAAPTSTLELFKERVRPSAPVNEKEVLKLVADLDNESFPAREKATTALAELGDRAELLMRKARKSAPSEEALARLELILANVGKASSQIVQMYRAIEVLETIGSPAAAAIIQQLADGLPQMRLTEEAQATLQRMKIGIDTGRNRRIGGN